MTRLDSLTAIFGGTFDPPHLGHRAAVAGLFGLASRVIVIPSPSPPHKPTSASAEHRAAMTRLAFGPGPDLPGPVEISELEMERARRAPGPTYTYDTLRELSPHYGQLAFVIGTDQLAQLPTWYRYPEVLSLCDWFVLERKPGGLDAVAAAVQTLGAVARSRGPREWEVSQGRRLRSLPTEAAEVSSSKIRELLALGRELPVTSLAPQVMDYLLANRLYGTSPAK